MAYEWGQINQVFQPWGQAQLGQFANRPGYMQQGFAGADGQYNPQMAQEMADALKPAMQGGGYTDLMGFGGSMTDYIERLYSKLYGRRPDEAGNQFWNDQATGYMNAGTPDDTSDDRSMRDTQAWLVANFLKGSNEAAQKATAAASTSNPDYTQAEAWGPAKQANEDYLLSRRQMPYALDYARMTQDPGANMDLVHPPHLQPGGVRRIPFGGTNLATLLGEEYGYDEGFQNNLYNAIKDGAGRSTIVDMIGAKYGDGAVDFVNQKLSNAVPRSFFEDKAPAAADDDEEEWLYDDNW